MDTVPASAKPHDRVVILTMPRFPSLCLAHLTNVLRLSNRELGRTTFEWTIASPAGGPVRASDGLSIDSIPAAQAPDCDIAFVVAAYRPTEHLTKPTAEWLRRRAAAGTYLVGIESGTFVLAETGILGRHEPALHFENVAAFRERWPERAISERTFTMGERIGTAAGVTATLDFALAFLERRRGPRLADQVGRVLYHDRWRGRDRGPMSGGILDGGPMLKRCRSLMVENLQDPLPIPTLCARLGIDERRLRRLFQRAIGTSPLQYYKAIRLKEARYILINADMPVTQVGQACGFTNAAAFAKAFKAHFGFPPSRHRDPYMGLSPSPFWREAPDRAMEMGGEP